MYLTNKTRARLAHFITLALVVTLAAPPALFSQAFVAQADIIQATVVGGTGDQTKVPGAMGTASFFLIASNTVPPTDGGSGCNATGSNPATITVTSTNPSVVTINSPNSGTVVGCGNPVNIGYTVSSSATPGTRVTINGTGSGGKPGSQYTVGAFDVIISDPPDSSPPTISAAGVPSGWTNMDPVTVTLNAADNVGLKSITYALDGAVPLTQLVSGVSAGAEVLVSGNGVHTLSYCATDAANNTTCPATAAATSTIKIDTIKPTISGAPTTSPNAANWYNSNVIVAWTCADPPFPMGTIGGTAPSGIVPSGTGACPGDSTITGEGRNLSAGPVTVKDVAGNTSDPASVTGIKIDRTAPTISAAIVKDDGSARSPDWVNAGATWYKGSVTVRFTCSDPSLADTTAGSGVAQCPANAVLSSDGNNLSASGTATDLAGNTSAPGGVSGINIDGTPPQSTADLSCTQRNGFCRGTTATVVLTASDLPPANLPGITPSGVKEIRYSTNGGQSWSPYQNAITIPLNGSGKATVQFYAVDNVGNIEPTNSVEIKYDTIAPTITHTLSPAPNAAGWNKANVTVEFTAVDDPGGSGVDVASLSPLAPNITPIGTAATGYTWTGAIVSSETTAAGMTVTGHAEDLAGNEQNDPVTVKLDKTAPTITGAPTTNPNANNWYKGAVTVKFTCGDALSGVVSCEGWNGLVNNGVTLTSTGRNQQVQGTAVDKADNTASFAVTGINIDSVAPLITLNGIAAGTTYVLGAVPVASCTAEDPALADNSAGSGVDGTCSVTVTGGTSSGVGTFNFTATAKDFAGNTATLTGSYQVQYAWAGFRQPINDTAHQVGTSTSIFKAASTVPAKFQLKDANGTIVQASTLPKWLTPAKGSVTSSPVDESVYGDPATSGATYRWDATSQQYIYNWGTARNQAGNYWRIGVELDDGQIYFVNIGLR